MEDTKGSTRLNELVSLKLFSWIVHCILQFSWKDFQFYKPAKIVELMLLFNR